eukprot:TRINITY_DN26107_c0_g1_i1.p1 TRINITY_DN26107_c0_g1~~TRINITY_DN26107_c0_g1_i1.p1  ORF type:complete len:252 (+),score=30.14 TRINITY_DN26107_c0_g1_i1:84-758(+)
MAAIPGIDAEARPASPVQQVVRPAPERQVDSLPPFLDVAAEGRLRPFSGRYLRTPQQWYGGPVYQQQGGHCRLAGWLLGIDTDAGGVQEFSWRFFSDRQWEIRGVETTYLPQQVTRWKTRSWGLQAVSVISILLRALGEELRDPEVFLRDIGLSAESAVEFVSQPAEAVAPASDGPLAIYCRAPALGWAEPFCLEVAADTTVGGLAALAAVRMGLRQETRRDSQ